MTRARRLVVVSLALALLGLAGARLADDVQGGHLRADTRAVLHLAAARHELDVEAPTSSGPGPGGANSVHPMAEPRPARPAYPRRVLMLSTAPTSGLEPVARTARRRRLALLVGGHGRLGAG